MNYTVEPDPNGNSRMKNKMIAAIVIAVSATSGTTAQEIRRQGKASRTPQPSKYLETGGERKLEVVYKNISGRNLTLDLYYPTARRSKKCPVVVFTHGGGWAAGNRFKAASGSVGIVQQVAKSLAVPSGSMPMAGLCSWSSRARPWKRRDFCV